MEGLLIFLAFCVALFFAGRFVYRRVPWASQRYRVVVRTDNDSADVRIAKRFTDGAYGSDRIGSTQTVWFSDNAAEFKAELEEAIAAANKELDSFYTREREAKHAAKQIKQIKRKAKI